MVATWTLRLGMTMILYAGIYDLMNAESIKGIDFPMAASSMLLYAVFSGFGTRDISRAIDMEFKSGVIEIWLNKPIPYLVLKTGQSVGKNIPAATAIITATMGFWFIGGFLPDVLDLPLRFLCGLVLLVFGLVAGTLLYSIIGLTSVFLHDGKAIYLINDKLIMVFGGIYIPIGFFPENFRLIGEALPTGSAIFVTQMFYPDLFENLPRFIALQIFWIGAMGFALYRLNKAVNNHMTVNGG